MIFVCGRWAAAITASLASLSERGGHEARGANQKHSVVGAAAAEGCYSSRGGRLWREGRPALAGIDAEDRALFLVCGLIAQKKKDRLHLFFTTRNLKREPVERNWCRNPKMKGCAIIEDGYIWDDVGWKTELQADLANKFLAEYHIHKRKSFSISDPDSFGL